MFFSFQVIQMDGVVRDLSHGRGGRVDRDKFESVDAIAVVSLLSSTRP